MRNLNVNAEMFLKTAALCALKDEEDFSVCKNQHLLVAPVFCSLCHKTVYTHNEFDLKSYLSATCQIFHCNIYFPTHFLLSVVLISCNVNLFYY